MMSFRRLAAGSLAVALLAIPLVAMLFLTGCRKQDKLVLDSNLVPDTRLTSAPGPYSQANYRIHLYWDGTDPDGFVVAYHYAWDDTVPPYGAENSPWQFTTKSDSLFKALIDTAGETRRHTFYIRSVDNEGKLDPTPARVRFDAWTDLPRISYLYRKDGPMDPNVGTPDPTVKDTVLMGLPVRFLWSGFDPDGLGAPVEYSYRLDSNPFAAYTDSTGVTYPIVGAGTHFFYVKAKDETGAENFPKNYKFVMNYEPDSELLEPAAPTGTLTFEDGSDLWFRWSVRDKEELMGLDGGVAQIWINLDNDFLKGFTVNQETGDYVDEWYFTSAVAAADSHYISSRNSPQGGNAIHLFEIWAKDVEGTFERVSRNPDDREFYEFWYNYPPSSTILFPSEGETVGPDFEILWEGSDQDGEVAAYQYVLNPWENAYVVCQVDEGSECNSQEYFNIEPSASDSIHPYHEFRLRAQDESGCWEETWNIVRFYVEESK
jgi:hypothetical protein